MANLQSTKTIIQYYWKQQLRYPRLLFGMVFFHPLAILFLRFLPALIVADILNRLSTQEYIKGDLWGSFGPSIVWMIVFEAIGGLVLWRVVIYFNWKLEAYVTRDIERKIFDHLMHLSATFHANRFGGSLVSQTAKFSSAYIRFTDTTLFQVMGLLWALLFSSVLLVGKAPLFVALLIGFTILYLACAVYITRSVRKFNIIEADASNTQTGYLADAITNVMAVKGFAATKAENERFGSVSEKTRQPTVDLMWATLRRQTIFGSIGTILSAVSLVLAVASVVLFNAEIALVFLILNYTSDILVRLWEFSTQALRDYNRAFGDAQAMSEILAMEPGITDPAKPERLRIKHGAIILKDVSFSHGDAGSGDALFDKLNLSIAGSEKIGLVGHSGSGKTTLTKLLLRFNDVDGGTITIDGQNIAAITQDDLRRSIAYVPQEPLLFHRTIRENIAYGNPGASNEEVIAAAKKAFAHEFITTLSDGYETMVGERGVKLSGGQRQRIVIARAILKDAPILVLDEATSALDSESEKLIQAALWKLMENRTAIVIAHRLSTIQRTAIVIAHRLSTIQRMDRIIVLDHGTVAEAGTHQSLLKDKGTYARLWAHQSGGFLEE
ncbi:MAG: ABC transporter ATP-binding protein [Candidatus Saccharimonadales bacterium]